MSGNYDILQQPKNISEDAKRNVCFFMFLDEETEAAMRNASHLDGSKKAGLWRIVIVNNLPYTDPRRNGKVNLWFILVHQVFIKWQALLFRIYILLFELSQL